MVLEGTRDGLPLFCSDFPNFRIDGRSWAERLTTTPAEVGLTGVEIEWRELRPAEDLRGFERRPAPAEQGGWALSVGESVFALDDGIDPGLGTFRFAAALRLPDGTMVKSRGWDHEDSQRDPENAPGYRVTRAQAPTFTGRLTGLSRLPVRAQASDAHIEHRVAFTSCDLVRAAIEDWMGTRLHRRGDAPFGDQRWDWLLEPVFENVRRSDSAESRAVSTEGRGVHWRARGADSGVAAGDIVLTESGCAVLAGDNGDGWLGNADVAFHTENGALERGTLGGVPGGAAHILRIRNFRELRVSLTKAGYGELGHSALFGPDVERAVADFQRDQDLTRTGRPDAATTARLAEFLGALDSVGDDASAGSR